MNATDYRLPYDLKSFQTRATKTKSYGYTTTMFKLANQVLFPQQVSTRLDNQIIRANMRYPQHMTYTGGITPGNIFSSLDELNVYELSLLSCNENGFDVTISVKT